MSKKLSRSQRKERRDLGIVEAPPRAAQEARREQQRAESQAEGARRHAASEAVATREVREVSADKTEEDVAPRPTHQRRDRTVLVLVGLTALAALIFWLTQRSPTTETKIEAAAPIPAATGSAKP